MVIMLSARAVALAVSLVAFFALARLLQPDAFGYFAVAMAIGEAARTLGNFGLRQRIVSAPENLSPEELAEATGLSLAITAALAGLLVVGSLLLRGAPVPAPLADALIPIGLATLVGPIILNAEASLQRRLAFGIQAHAAVVSTLADATCAIAFAWAGGGALALGLGVLAGRVGLAAVLLWSSPDLLRRPRFTRASFRRFAAFGGRLTTINLLPRLADLVLMSALGAVAGAFATGIYNRARTIFGLLDRTILEGIAPVVLPAVSASLRSGRTPGAVLATKLSLLAALCWPGFAMIFLLADPLVRVLLGPGWDAAVMPVQILAAGGVAVPFTRMSIKLFTAIDALRDFLVIQTSYQSARAVLGVAAAFVSLEAFCAAMSISLVLNAVHISLVLRHRLGETPASALRAVCTAGPLTAATLALPVLIVSIGQLTAVGTLAASLAGGAVGWLAALFLLDHPLADDLRILAGRLRRP